MTTDHDDPDDASVLQFPGITNELVSAGDVIMPPQGAPKVLSTCTVRFTRWEIRSPNRSISEVGSRCQTQTGEPVDSSVPHRPRCSRARAWL